MAWLMDQRERTEPQWNIGHRFPRVTSFTALGNTSDFDKQIVALPIVHDCCSDCTLSAAKAAFWPLTQLFQVDSEGKQLEEAGCHCADSGKPTMDVFFVTDPFGITKHHFKLTNTSELICTILKHYRASFAVDPEAIMRPRLIHDNHLRCAQHQKSKKSYKSYRNARLLVFIDLLSFRWKGICTSNISNIQ